MGSRSVGSKGQNINQKLQKKNTLKPQIWTIEKREIIKISWFLNGSSLSIKISKNKTFWNFALVEKFSKFYGNNLDPDPDPFLFSAECGSKIRIRIKIKWILSTAPTPASSNIIPHFQYVFKNIWNYGLMTVMWQFLNT